MDITMLKSGLWGYQKSSVCQYIALINEEFSRKLMDTVEIHEQKERELREKIAQLEEETARLREERDQVSLIISEAQAFSDNLRRNAEAEAQKLQENNKAYYARQRAHITELCTDINGIRDVLCHLLEPLDTELEKVEEDLTALDDRLQISADLENESVV